MKAQIFAENESNLKSNLTAEQQKWPVKFERERLNFKIKMLKYGRRLREVVSRDVILRVFIAVRVGVFAVLLRDELALLLPALLFFVLVFGVDFVGFLGRSHLGDLLFFVAC